MEANAVRAKLAASAEKWPWSGLAQRIGRVNAPPMTEWPVDRPSNWSRLVNDSLPKEQLEKLRECVVRGRPWGDVEWVLEAAERMGLGFTLRNPGRPCTKTENQ